jgi:phosphatidylserine decarboxylase
MDLAPGAYRWAAVPLVAGVAGGVVSLSVAGVAGSPVPPLVAGVGVLLAGGVLAFFRDPDRSPDGEGVLAPADGTVSVVREETGGRLRVGTFMNVTDVHVNRAPLAGEVVAVEHEPGGHWPAFTKAAERNERRRFHVEAADAADHEVVQIAGTLARRTHPYVETGDAVDRGERIGHIAFGSRVDVVLPPAYDGADLQVAEGDGVRAGETVLARRAGD